MFLTAEKQVHFGIIVEPAVMKGAYMSVSKNSIDSTIQSDMALFTIAEIVFLFSVDST